ncbi:MAG: Wzz/FepE/Etk N-terminal domain-containing protein, partial [Ferruginibacter sp.]
MNKQIPGEQISLKELLVKMREGYSYLLSKWRIIFLFAIAGALLGLSYSFIKKPVYTAYLSFALEDDQQDGLSGALGLVSQFGFDIGESGGGMFSGANLIELFKSRTMVEQTLLKPAVVNGKTISLAEMYIQHAKWRELWVNNAALSKLQFQPNAGRQTF